MTLLEWLWRHVSPVEMPRTARERFLLPHEWLLIREVLVTKPVKVRVYFTFLFLTGCRRDEARNMHWSELDDATGLWHKRPTKNGKRHLLPLSSEACELLRTLPKVGPYCFTGATVSEPWSRTAITYWWRKIRFESGCPDIRIHDLRRSTASWMTMRGENMKVVQQTLGHSDMGVTGRVYAHLDIASLRDAMQRHAEKVLH